MGHAYFRVNALVLIHGEEHRVHRKLATEWQLENTRTLQIRTLDQAKMLRMMAGRDLVIKGSADLSHCGTGNLKLSDKDLELATMRLAYVRDTLSVSNTLAPMNAAILTVWTRLRRPSTPPSFTSVYSWKERYLQSGHDIRALVNHTSKKGNRLPRFPKEIISMAKDSISEVYLQRPGRTIKGTLTHALSKAMKANEERLKGDELRVPTLRLITRLVAEIPAFDVCAARLGPQLANMRFRSVKGHRITDHPLERAEIDHTVLDIFVIDEATGTPLGRPHLTACIDDHTRCILGIYIGFTPPSSLSVQRCLKDCFLPKTSLRFDYPRISNEWDAFGVMHELVIDNGLEFHGKALEQICFSLGIGMHFAPRKQGWFKGKIERFFGTLSRDLLHVAPGTTFANTFDKGDYDPVKHSVITLKTLRETVRKWIADDYHQSQHRSLMCSPAAKWKNSIRFEDIRQLDDSIDMDVIMGFPESRVLTHKGIEYAGLLYNSADIQALRRMHGPKLKVDLRIDEDNLESVILLWDGAKPFVVPALNPEYTRGLNLWFHDVLKNRLKVLGKEQNISALILAKEEIAKLMQGALLQKRKSAGRRVGRALEAQGNPSTTGTFLDALHSGAPESNLASTSVLSRPSGPKAFAVAPPPHTAAKLTIPTFKSVRNRNFDE